MARRRVTTIKKNKAVNYELLDQKKHGAEYVLLEQMRDDHHPELSKAKIALAWRKATKADKDGRLVLGRCVKVSALQREMVDLDFVIVLNKEVWQQTEFTREKKLALLDHELCHAAVVEDKYGEPKFDEKDRQLFRMRKHDIEEFASVIDHHGCYKKDLEKFAEILLAKKQQPLFEGKEETESDGDKPRRPNLRTMSTPRATQ